MRPDHLFLGTDADNSADMVAKGRSQHQKGESSNNSKLKEFEVRDIRAKVALGYTRKAMAELYKVHPAHVSDIVNKKVWKHLDEE